MKAAIFYRPFDVRIETLPKTTPGENEALVKVKSAGVCGTDIQIFRGESPINPPIVLGHDFSGVIEAIGGHVGNFSPGDRVTVQPVGYCGSCDYCRRGRQNLCREGEWIGFERNGGFAEYALLRDYNLLKVPDHLSFDEAAVVEPVAVGLRTLRLAGAQIGDTIAIIGLGSIGLVLTQICKLAGLEVIGVDLDVGKMELAKKLGADYVLDGREEKMAKRVFEITSGLDVHITVEASGTQEGIDAASEITMPGGKMMIVGHKKRATWPSDRPPKRIDSAIR
jgi:L-iditol 2-dehydrogenase